MQAFHNDEKIKSKYLDRVVAHQKADNLIRGKGWENGRGCAVGCTLEEYDHAKYETELGIPAWVASLEDILFENMSEEKSRTWPEEFLKAVNVGADLEKTKTPFVIFLMQENLKSMDSVVFDSEKFPDVQKVLIDSKAAVNQMIEAWKYGDADKIKEAASAAWSAESAARAAEAASLEAESAAWSAESAARSAAWSAARSAASAAWSAAELTASAAWSAARSAASAARSAESAAAAAAAAFDKYADKLLEIIRETK
jgi:hypothetical protein